MIDKDTFERAKADLEAHDIDTSVDHIRAYLLGKGTLAAIEESDHSGRIQLGDGEMITYGHQGWSMGPDAGSEPLSGGVVPVKPFKPIGGTGT
jgi:hypothetical protein